MKTILICALTTLAGCATDTPTAEAPSNLICSPLCDSGYQPELQGAYSYGFGLFVGARSTDANCADIGTSVQRWDCVVTFVSPANPCGVYTVECIEQGPGLAPRCNWSNPYNCQ